MLYLAVHHHVGFLSALAEFGWRAMVFEGAETDSVEMLERTLGPLTELCEIEIVWAKDFRDSETLYAARRHPSASMNRGSSRPNPWHAGLVPPTG